MRSEPKFLKDNKVYVILKSDEAPIILPGIIGDYMIPVGLDGSSTWAYTVVFHEHYRELLKNQNVENSYMVINESSIYRTLNEALINIAK